MTHDQKESGSRHMRQKPRPPFAALIGVAASLLAAAPAVAQQFEKVDEATRENLPATPFVGAAYAFIWIAILVYVVVTARRVRRVETDLANLRRRVDGSTGGGSAAPR